MPSGRCSRTLAALIALAVGLGAASTAAQAPQRGKSVGVPNQKITGPGAAVEGDLITVAGTPVRLMGIDAPERGQICRNRYNSGFDCFAISKAVLENLMKDAEVECVIADRDRNGQNQGECFVRGIDLGAAMVARGWAFAYRSLSPAYASSEAFAQTRRLGLWSGKVEKPWEWRSKMLRGR